MKFDSGGFARVVESSGFTKRELAYIYGVSRQTIYDWLREHSAPSQLALSTRAAKTTEVLLLATSGPKPSLPFRKDIRPEERKRRISVITTRIMASLKPAERP